MNSMAFALVSGVIMATGIISMRMSFEAKNNQLVHQINSIEGFYSADLAASTAFHAGAGITQISESALQKLIRRYRTGMLKTSFDGKQYCGESQLTENSPTYRTCILTASAGGGSTGTETGTIVKQDLILNLDAALPSTSPLPSNMCSLRTWRDLSRVRPGRKPPKLSRNVYNQLWLERKSPPSPV